MVRVPIKRFQNTGTFVYDETKVRNAHPASSLACNYKFIFMTIALPEVIEGGS